MDYSTHCDSRGTHDPGAGRGRSLPARPPDRPDHRPGGALAGRGGASRRNRWGAFFFLNLHYTSPHWPGETRGDEALAQEVKANLFHLHGGKIHRYRQIIHHRDEGIGRVMSALQQAGLLHNTLVAFTSDNWPLVGGKVDLTEGGIRLPWIACGPSCSHCTATFRTPPPPGVPRK